jgi:hypothetical protein
MSESEAWAEHLIRLDRYSKATELVYRNTVKEFLKMWILFENSVKDPVKTPFKFSLRPAINDRVQSILRKMHKDLVTIISTGTEREFMAAHAKQDGLIDKILKGYKVEPEVLQKLKHRNLEALEAFQQRKIGGMNLSGRVWKITKQFEAEMELIVDLGLSEGKTAQQIAREAQPLLNEPNRLYRRVRDARGQLHLSKAAKAYNPGQGIYRSSFKNSFRMSRTEMNMAYRVADHDRRLQNPLVIGYEVKRSNNPYPCDVCEAFKGRYPKSYIFRSNHPQCRCYAIEILGAPEEIEDWISAGAEGPLNSVNEVTTMPEDWRKWMKENQKRLLTAKNPPYWVLDNFKQGNVSKGLKIDIPWQ